MVNQKQTKDISNREKKSTSNEKELDRTNWNRGKAVTPEQNTTVHPPTEQKSTK